MLEMRKIAVTTMMKQDLDAVQTTRMEATVLDVATWMLIAIVATVSEHPANVRV